MKSATTAEHVSMSADKKWGVLIRDIREKQKRRFRPRRRSFWLTFLLSSTHIDWVTEDDPSGLGGCIIAPASFVDSSAGNVTETDVQALRKDWVAVGNDLRIAMLRRQCEHGL